MGATTSSSPPDTGRASGSLLWLWIALGAFALAIVVVDPLRETPLEDDWAYALTVRHLLETGEYRLHDWAAANMPFQAYWGALFAELGGYSFSMLRISTLLLALLGFVSFYNLAREHGFDRTQGGLLTLIFISSPLLLRFSFNFMTDVPFVALLVTSLWLYSRAIRSNGVGWMIVASAAAAATILTRQFGMALIAGVALLMLTDREYRRRPFFFLAGLLLPAIAAGWQLWMGIEHPTWAQGYARLAQSGYLASPVVDLFVGLLWRIVVILLYMALFAIPLAVIAFVVMILRWRDQWRGRASAMSRWWRWEIGLQILFFFGIVLGAGSMVLDTPRLMPYLPWSFEIVEKGGAAGQALVSAFMIIGSIALVPALLLGFTDRDPIARTIPPARRLLGFTTLVLLGLNLIFFKIGDEYLLAFIPFTLLTGGWYLREQLSHSRVPVAIVTLLVLVGSALWTRNVVAEGEALWTGAERARRLGAAPEQIHSSWIWASYHGAFDRYLQSIGRQPKTTLDEFFVWHDSTKRLLPYRVTAAPQPTPGERWTVLDTVTYRGLLLTPERLYVVRVTRE